MPNITPEVALYLNRFIEKEVGRACAQQLVSANVSEDNVERKHRFDGEIHLSFQ